MDKETERQNYPIFFCLNHPDIKILRIQKNDNSNIETIVNKSDIIALDVKNFYFIASKITVYPNRTKKNSSVPN